MMWLTIDYNDIDYDNDADHNDAMDDDNDATDDAIDTEQWALWADLVLRWAVGGRLSLWGGFDPTGAL